MMKGADMVVGWVDKTGKSFFTDRHGRGNFQPIVDTVQDYTLHELTQKDGTTNMTFSRKLVSCDKEDNIINQDTMRVLYAWNDADPVDNKYMTKHSHRGSKSLLLLGFTDATIKTEPKIEKYFDLKMKDHTIQPTRTMYMCKAFEIPKTPSKQHLIRVERIITPGNENYVHHMLIYVCSSADNGTLEKQHECREDNMPGLRCNSFNMVHAWAIGGTDFYYPENVGLPLNDVDSPRYLLLEIHYDNPDLRSGIVDHSGLRLVYTDQLRKYDARVLQMGTDPGKSRAQIIPQGQNNFTTYAFCHSSCLQIPKSEKHYVFASFLHAHTAGRKITARLIRESDNTEVGQISVDNNYDFNYQEIRSFNKPVEIPAGHSIHLDCVYNTEDRSSPVTGGLGSDEEMCMAYLFIYPKLNLETCYSEVYNGLAFGSGEGYWKADDKHRIIESYKVNGQDFNGFRIYKAFQESAFWRGADRQDLVRQFEYAGLTYPYGRICNFEKGPKNESYFKFDYVANPKNAYRRLMKDDVCAVKTTEAPLSTTKATKSSKANTIDVISFLILALCSVTAQLIC